MANFLKFWAVVWAVGIVAGFFAGGFGGGAEPCYNGPGGLVDRFSKGFTSRVQISPGVVTGATDMAAAKSRVELMTVARLIGVLTGYYAGYSIHYALYASACAGPQLNQAPK
jgi:hypothetical protein